MKRLSSPRIETLNAILYLICILLSFGVQRAESLRPSGELDRPNGEIRNDEFGDEYLMNNPNQSHGEIEEIDENSVNETLAFNETGDGNSTGTSRPPVSLTDANSTVVTDVKHSTIVTEESTVKQRSQNPENPTVEWSSAKWTSENIAQRANDDGNMDVNKYALGIGIPVTIGLLIAIGLWVFLLIRVHRKRPERVEPNSPDDLKPTESSGTQTSSEDEKSSKDLQSAVEPAESSKSISLKSTKQAETEKSERRASTSKKSKSLKRSSKGTKSAVSPWKNGSNLSKISHRSATTSRDRSVSQSKE